MSVRKGHLPNEDDVVVKDDRTDEQKKTHGTIVVATDRVLSGWGNARDGNAYAGWACRPSDVYRVLSWVGDRQGMSRVRVVRSSYRPNSRYCVHFHIFVVNESHPALS